MNNQDKFSITVNSSQDRVKMSFTCSDEKSRKDFVELAKTVTSKIEKIAVQISGDYYR